jgi:hypothetical protein
VLHTCRGGEVENALEWMKLMRVADAIGAEANEVDRSPVGVEGRNKVWKKGRKRRRWKGGVELLRPPIPGWHCAS